MGSSIPNFVIGAILVVVAGSATFWGYGEHEQLQLQKQAAAKELQATVDADKKIIDEQSHKIAELQQNLVQVQGVVQAQQASDNGEIQRLNQLAMQSWYRLQSLQQKIAALKGQSPAQDVDLPTQIQQQKELAADLENRLKQAQAAEKDVGHESDDAVKNVKAQTQYNIANLNAQIQAQQAVIRATQEQLTFWRKRKGDVNQLDKIALYQQQLTDQQAGLEQLRGQKAGFAQNEQTQAIGLKQEAAQEKDNIKSSEGQLRDQLQRVQQDMKTLQQQQQSNKKTVDDGKSKLRQAEQDYSTEYAKYQSIQDSLKKIRADAQRLKQ